MFLSLVGALDAQYGGRASLEFELELLKSSSDKLKPYQVSRAFSAEPLLELWDVTGSDKILCLI